MLTPPPPLFRYAPARHDGGFRMPGYWVWGSSVIRGEDGRYHLFASRWPQGIPFHPGWLTDSEIVRAVADQPLGPFAFAEVVLGKRGAEYWDGQMAHNPRIVKAGGVYLLFYTGSTYPYASPQPGEPLTGLDPRAVVARAHKRTGVAVAERLTGPWTRFDAPVLPTRPGSFYSFLTSNATPVVNSDGSIYLMFKSRRYDGHKHSRMFIGAATAAAWNQPFTVLSDAPLIGPACHLDEIEDPYVWRDAAGGWHLMAKDLTGSLCGEEAGGVLARSPDGLKWELETPPQAYSRTVPFADGTSVTFDKRERPFILFEDGRPRVLYTAVGAGDIYGNAPGSATWNLAVAID